MMTDSSIETTPDAAVEVEAIDVDNEAASSNITVFRGLVKDECAHHHNSGYTRLIIRRAKLNWKYRCRRRRCGKYKRRIKDPDLDVIQKFCTEENIHVGYDEFSDDIWFETHYVKKSNTNNTNDDDNNDDDDDDIELDGWDTGGQIIRLFMSAAINSTSSSRRMIRKPPATLHIEPFYEEDRVNGKKGKACMLYIQARLWTLRVGDTFTVVGGDPMNDDALPSNEHEALFTHIRQVFGRNFTMRDLTGIGDNSGGGDSGIAHFMITRHDDIRISRSTTTNITTDAHTVDQLLMGAVLIFYQQQQNQKQAGTIASTKNDDDNEEVDNNTTLGSGCHSGITIRCPPSRDYHIDAMIRAGRLFGMKIDDTKPVPLLGLDRGKAIHGKDKDDKIEKWIKAGKERIITVYY